MGFVERGQALLVELASSNNAAARPGPTPVEPAAPQELRAEQSPESRLPESVLEQLVVADARSK